MKEFWNNLKFVWMYAREQKGYLIKFVLITVLDIIISIIVPILSAKKIVNLTNNLFYQLVDVTILIFLIDMVGNVFNYLASFYSQRIYRGIFIKLKVALGESVLSLKNDTVDKNGSGVFIQRMSGDASDLADIFNRLTFRLDVIITDIGIFVALFIVNKIFFAIIIVLVFIKYLVEKARIDIYVKNNKERKRKNEKVTGFVGELVRGVRDIKMLNAEKSFLSELGNRVTDLNQFAYNMMATNRNYLCMRGIVADFTDLIVIVYLGFIAYKGVLEVAVALVLFNYSNRVKNIVSSSVDLLDSIKEFNVSSERVRAIIEGDEFPKESFGEKHIDHVNGDFEFKNVSFSYGKNKVLDNLSFKVNQNETVAFVGKSGAGKTTIFNLLCKMYDPKKGTITIDGVSIKKLDKDTIRGNITIISQNPYIFNMTVRENLKLVKEDLTDEDMIKACKMACLHDFIMEQPDGYDTMIGEGGLNLSGGQKQRLAIARAFVQKTEIILFDEATSALDNETQSEIQKAISNMKGEYTILIIAHRLSTIINADRILFINEGKVEMEGSHKELLKTCENYKHLYESEIKNRR